MTKKELLLQEIDSFPEPLLEEVVDFVHFLRIKTLQEKNHPIFASESALKKDWLEPEEDKAWQNL